METKRSIRSMRSVASLPSKFIRSVYSAEGLGGNSIFKYCCNKFCNLSKETIDKRSWKLCRLRQNQTLKLLNEPFDDNVHRLMSNNDYNFISACRQVKVVVR